jgi:hypothetical protein
MRFRAAFVSKTAMKTNPSTDRSLRQNSNRLAAYLATGIAAGLVATPVAEAAIVTIDITTTGFGIDGPNAGISPGGLTLKNNFPVSGGGALGGYNIPIGKGIFGTSGLLFATGSSNASPVKFTPYQSIDSSANWTAGGKSLFKFYSLESPDFGSGSYMGFKTAQGNYGWLQATWAGATDTFQFYSGAYESVAGVAILAGDTGGGAVPEPGQVASSLLLLALGTAGVAIQRQRAKKKQQAEAVALS